MQYRFNIKTSLYLCLLIAISSCADNTHTATLGNNESETVITENSDTAVTGFDPEQRVSSIREMYNAANALAKQHKGTCEEKKENEHYTYADDLPPRPIVQIVEKCVFNDGYTIVKAKFQGPGWYEGCTYYYQNEKLFFAFMEYANEACSGEVRFYYHENSDIFRTLLKTKDCVEGNIFKEPTENFDLTLKSEFEKTIAENLKKANRILGK